MTKKLMFVLMLSIMFTLTFAQTYLTESFEGEWAGTPAAPANWTQVAGVAGSGSGSDIAWAKSTYSGTAWVPAGNGTKPAGAQNGTSVAWYNDYNAQAGQRDSLITPAINLATATNPRVSFYYMYASGTVAKLRVYASANGVSDWVEISPIAGLGATGAAWTKVQYNLSNFLTANMKLAFVTVGAYGSNDFWLDSFSVEETPQIAPEAVTLGFPANNMTTVNNPMLRWTPATSGELALGYKVYISTSSTFGEPVATVTTNYYVPTGLLNATTYNWKVVAYNTYGDATGGNIGTFTTVATTQLAESFEGTVFPPAGWAIDPSTWTTNSSYNIEGFKCTSVSSSTITTPELARKLITPKVTVSATSTLQFIAATTSTTAQYLIVKSSPDKVTWTDLGTAYTLTNSWTIYNVDLSSLAGQNLYFAVGAYRATASGTILLDHVVGPDLTIEAPGVASTPVPADAATAVLAIPSFSWATPTTGGIPTGYKVYLGTENPPTTLVSTVVNPSYVSTSVLNYATTYYWSIVPTNTAGDATGCPVWSFTTMDDPTISVPVNEPFATYPPLNWEEKIGLLTDPVTLTGTSSAWGSTTAFANVTGHEFGTAVKINIYGTSRKEWMITPPINLGTETGLQLEFDLALTDWNNANPAELPAPDDKFAVVVSTDNGLTWTTTNILRLWDNDETTTGPIYDSIATAGEHVIIPLTQTGIVRFAFYGESTISNGDSDLHIDNVQVRPTPTIPIFAVNPVEKNFGLTVLNTTTPAQIFTISNGGTGSLGITSVALTGTDADQFILTDTNTYPALVTNETNITVAVAFNPTSVGEKTAILIITDALTRTAHEVILTGSSVDPTITIPSTQNFDEVTIPALPIGWVCFASQTGTDARPWVTQVATATNPGAQSTPNFVGSFYHSTNPKNEWLVTPNVMLTAGTTYRIKFWVKAPGWSGTPEKMKLVVGNAQTLDAMTTGTILWDDPNMLIPSYTLKMAAFTPTTTGAYFFGWHSYSDADVDYIAMDDLSFEVGPVENPPTALTGTPGNAIANLSWTAPAAGSTGTLAGYKVYRDSTAITTAPVTGTTYSDNTAVNGTTYSYYVTALYTTPDGESTPSNTVIVTPTAPILYPPTGLTASVVNDDVTLNWLAGGPNGEYISHGGEYTANVGTNAAANFSVAHRFTPAQLTALGVTGGQVTKLRFVGHIATATYTAKVWTGGSGAPYAPGTEVASQVVSAINVDDWTEIEFTTPITIPANAELWFGYNVNTPSGNPAGADAGPQLDGFGNIMYFNNAWTTLSTLSATLTRNWCLEAFVINGSGQVAKLAAPVAPERIKAVMDNKPIENDSNLQASVASYATPLRNVNRNLTGYKVYRGTTLLTATPLPPTTLTYQDMNLANGTYTYNVTAIYTDGESVPASIDATVNTALIITTFPWNEGFEGTFPPTGWSNIDNDNDQNIWFQYLATGTAHAGTKSAASASWTSVAGALTPDNWFITPKIQLPTYAAGQTAKLKFWIAAQDPNFPNEHYSIMISTTNNNIASFTALNSTTLTDVEWVEKTIELNAYSGQAVYIAFRHHEVSGEFYLKLDDVSISIGAGSDTPEVAKTALSGNYPNPFNPITTIAYSVKDKANVSIDVYNIKGQKVRSLVNEVKNQGNHTVVWNGKDDSNRDAGSGIYFYRMKSGKFTATGKMILMK